MTPLPLSTIAQQRLAPRCFPATLDDPRLGLSGDPLLATLVHRTLSYAVMDPVDRRGDAVVYTLSQLLQLYAVGDVQGFVAPCPELAHVKLNSARAARRLLGIDFDEEREAWDLATDALVDVEHLCAYIPPPLWRVVERIILDGRETFLARASAVLTAEAKRAPKRSNSKRIDGGMGSLSQGWLAVLRRRAGHLVKPLFELAIAPPFDGLLARGNWGARPVTASDLGAETRRVVTRGESAGVKRVTDTTAPALRLVRMRFAQLDKDVKASLGWEPGDDEETLIKAVPEEMLTSTLEALLRDRLLVLWLPRFAPRAGSFGYLSEACVEFRHEFIDGEIGPGVLVFDPKTPTSAVWRWRPFEQELVPLIKAYRAIKRRRTPQTARDADLIAVPDAACGLLKDNRHHNAKVGHSPALFRLATSLRPVRATEINYLCTGNASRRPLVPRLDDPRRGYSPHPLARHLHRGLVSSEAAKRWCERHGEDPARRDVWGRMALDHKLAGLDALYKDDDSDLGRERGSRLGGRVVWQQLTTDLGLRAHRDGDTYRKALRARDNADEELRRIEDDFERQAERIEREGRDVPASAIVPLLRRQSQAARHRRELAELDRAIIGIESGHEDHLVLVADHIAHDEIPRVDLAEIKREHRRGIPEGRVRALRANHNWYTAEDLVELGFAKSATVRGWMKNAMEGKPVPSKAPWHSEDNPVFVFAGDSRRRAVYGSAVRFKTQEQRDMGAAILAREPREGWEHLPRMVPDPRPSVSSPRTPEAP